MGTYEKRRNKKIKPLVFALVAILSFGVLIGAGGKAYAVEGLGIISKSEGLVDKAWKFIGNLTGVFFGEDKTEVVEKEPGAEIVSEAAGMDYMMLINANNPVDRDYKPGEMVDIAEFVSATKSSIYLEKQAAESYINMVNAMKDAGLGGISAVSGYRDYDYQARLHNAEISRQRQYYSAGEAPRKAARIVAAPGTSEHQTGLAIDVSSRDIGYVLSSSFANTASFAWLKEHSHEYGFIVRYEKDKTDITGVIYEPWHLRYVGDEATDVYESGLCLEEYLNRE